MASESTQADVLTEENPDYGVRYKETKELDIAEVAKLIREELKLAKEWGLLAKSCKVNVRIQRYAGGQSLHLTAKQTGIAVRWSAEFYELENLLLEIANRFNYDYSNSMIDHSNVRFFARVHIETGPFEAARSGSRFAASNWPINRFIPRLFVKPADKE